MVFLLTWSLTGGVMSLIRKNEVNWLFVDVYGCVISVSVESYPTYKLAVMRAFNKSRGG
jgi:hypothetical protein|tara:strand:+ start:666 stop:842 length:177 start_codon:yes stop_codon:yes gene_type:complete